MRTNPNDGTTTGDFTRLLPADLKPQVILDVGSYTALQAIELHRRYPEARIFSFEANPDNIHLMEQNVVGDLNKYITIIPTAVLDQNGPVTFRRIKKRDTWVQQGSGSLYNLEPKLYLGDYWAQESITVPGTRLDYWAQQWDIKQVDLIWMDLQGADYEALLGAGELLRTVTGVHAEFMDKPMYEGQHLFPDIDALLTTAGLTLVRKFNLYPTWGDADWVRKIELPTTPLM